MDNAHASYSLNSAEFRGVTSAAIKLSVNTFGRKVDSWRLENGSVIFSKLCMHAIAVIKLLPPAERQSPRPFLELWDISSICALARAIIDSYYSLFYVMSEPLSKEELEMRRLHWQYQSEIKRQKLLMMINSVSPELTELNETIQSLKIEIASSSHYQALPASNQKEVLSGEKAMLLSNTELSQKAGIDPTYYQTTYRHLSSYVHAYPFALSQIRVFKADTDDSRRLLSTMVVHCTAYMSCAIDDFLAAFPDQRQHVTENTLHTVEIWKRIVKDIYQKCP